MATAPKPVPWSDIEKALNGVESATELAKAALKSARAAAAAHAAQAKAQRVKNLTRILDKTKGGLDAAFVFAEKNGGLESLDGCLNDLVLLSNEWGSKAKIELFMKEPNSFYFHLWGRDFHDNLPSHAGTLTLYQEKRGETLNNIWYLRASYLVRRGLTCRRRFS